MTEWRQIPSCPGYEASDDGRIRKGDRIVAQQAHRPPRGVYYRVQIFIDGKPYWRRVNRLVCEAFHGPPPTKRAQTRHRNGDSLDNRQDNLCWGTARDNYWDAVYHGTATTLPASVRAADYWKRSPLTPDSGSADRSLRELRKRNKTRMELRRERLAAGKPQANENADR